MTARSQAFTVLHYALAPICIALAALLHLSAAGVFLDPTGFFLLGVVAAAWFGGVGPGFFAALLATLVLPQLIEMNHPLTAGWLDLPRFVTFAITGLAVGWGTTRRRRAEALQRSEERYAIAMNAGEAGFWDWMVATDEFYASPRLLEMYGFPPGTTFAGRDDFLARFPLHPEDRLTWQESVAAHFTGKTARFDKELRTLRDGETRWLHLTGLATRDASGKVVRWTGSTTDITERKRAEEALRLSEERYAFAMEAAQDAHWDWIVGTDEYYTSPRVVDVFGLPPGTTFTSRLDYLAKTPLLKEDLEVWLRAARELFAGTGSRLSMELRAMVGGEIRWIQHNGVCLRDATGRPVRWCGSVRDVTERRRTEEALRLSEERYALAVIGAKDGIWDRDLTSGMLYLSPRAQEISMGRPSDGVDVRHDAEWRKWHQIHPDDAARREAAMREHLKGRTPQWEGEWRVRHQDGSYHWVHARGICTRDASGRAVRFAGSVTDIDARKRAEEALRISEERFALAVAASTDGIWDWDLTTNAMFFSERAQRIYGLEPGSTVRLRPQWRSMVELHPDDVKPQSDAIEDYLAGRAQSYDGEWRVRHAGGSYRWVRIRGLCVRDAAGQVTRLAGVVSDIDARKRTEEALRISEGRYAHAMEGSDAGHWDWNLVTDEMFVSKRAREMLALPDGPLPVRRDEIMALVPQHPEDRALMPEKIQFGIESGSHEREYRVIPRAGEVRWLRSRGKVFRDAQGVPVRLTGSLLDITERKLAADALRLSEERYALAMQASQEGHYDWNVQTDEIFVSPKTYELVGLPGDVKHANRTALIRDIPYHPEDRARLFTELAAVLASPALRHEFEYRIVVNGEGRWLTALWLIHRDAQGAARRVVCVLNDITERKLAADALRESEARFRSLTALSSDWYWRQDENFRFTYMSNQASALGGFSADDSIGKLRWDLVGVVPLSCSWAEHKAVLAAGKSFRDFEMSRALPDGSIGYFSISGVPIFDDDGRFRGYQGTGRSITERKRIEEELRARQEMLDLAQKSARAIAFEWKIGDGEGQNRWSPDLEAMYGFAPGTYDGTFETWKKVVHPEDWPAVKEAIGHAQRTGEVAFEYRVVHPDGSVRWLQAKGRILFDAAGKPGRMVGFMQDVTERKHAEEELRKMEHELRQAQRLEAMGTLAGGIAHDFNNILGAILGYGEMALRGAKKGTRLRRDLDSIMAAGERGRGLVDRILAFSRSGVGERVPVHVEAVVREALDLLGGATLPEGVRLRTDLRAGRAAMLGDPTQVHQVVMNLATNGLQAMPQGGVLRLALETVRLESPRATTVGSTAPGNYIVLKVADSGTGIAGDVLERMFDPFFTTKEVGVGSGLGLSLVHGIVINVGGAIDVATELGKGTTFTVYLPRSGDAPARAADENRPLPRGEGQRVLVVDDEEPLVRLATETLERLGYAPVGFTSSTAALAAFRADPQRFDAVLTDERMPGLSGSALIREVRGIRESIPVVLMSGYLGTVPRDAREGSFADALGVGADIVLRKPLLARELATSLARVLHQ